MPTSAELLTRLQDRGVVIHAPQATLIEGVDPVRIEAGVEIFPGCTLRGADTLLRAGTRLGRAGGGWFENIATGRGVDLYGGYFKDAVFLDGVCIRGHSEVRGGTLLEEGAEGAHHVGLKMSIFLPYVVAGSLINLCDVLFAGGTSRKDHSEIGSTLALYNFTPRGDKFASLFGDVPRGVFLRAPRIFLGGQTRVVSPVTVGYGSVIAAGSAVRRDVGEGLLYAEKEPGSLGLPFDAQVYGRLRPLFDKTARYVANLMCLLQWYQRVRLPIAAGDDWQRRLYEAAMVQIQAGIDERLGRLDKLVRMLPDSLAKLGGREERVREHRMFIEGWAHWREILAREPAAPESGPDGDPLAEIVQAYRQAAAGVPELRYIDFITGHLGDELVQRGERYLQGCLDGVLAALDW